MVPKRLVLAGLLLAMGSAHAASLYTVIDLETLTPGLGGLSWGHVSDINNSGQMVGLSTETGHAFLYDGTMRDLGTFGGSRSTAYGLNDRGQVVGVAESGNGSQHAFMYDGAMHDLGARWLDASAINNRGQVIGTAEILEEGPGVFVRAMLYDGMAHDLGTLGGSWSGARDINDSGQVVGVAETFGGVSHAFLYDGVMHDLGTFGGLWSEASGINNHGQVVGVAETIDEITHAFLYDGTMHDLGTLGGSWSDARDINDSGQVVGFFYDDRLSAFLYDRGVMSELNDLIDPLSGWSITTASAINDKGYIVARGHKAGGLDGALLLVPTTQSSNVPEPTSLALLSIGLFGLAAARRKKTARS